MNVRVSNIDIKYLSGTHNYRWNNRKAAKKSNDLCEWSIVYTKAQTLQSKYLEQKACVGTYHPMSIPVTESWLHPGIPEGLAASMGTASQLRLVMIVCVFMWLILFAIRSRSIGVWSKQQQAVIKPRKICKHFGHNIFSVRIKLFWRIFCPFLWPSLVHSRHPFCLHFGEVNV